MHSDYDPNTVIAQQEGERESCLCELKEKINNFLWMHLPGGTTLDRAEEMATKFYNEIQMEWDGV